MSDTGAAKLPGLPALKTTDKALADWSKLVNEHLEVRSGTRGNPMEKAVTQRDIQDVTKLMSALNSGGREAKTGDIPIDLGGGLSSSLSTDATVKALLANKTFNDAIGSSTSGGSSSTSRSSDATRVDTVARSQVAALEAKVNSVKTLADSAVTDAQAALDAAKKIASRGAITASGGWQPGLFSFAQTANYLIWLVLGYDTSNTAYTTGAHLVPGDTVTLREYSAAGVYVGPHVAMFSIGRTWVEQDPNGMVDGILLQKNSIPLEKLEGGTFGKVTATGAAAANPPQPQALGQPFITWSTYFADSQGTPMYTVQALVDLLNGLLLTGTAAGQLSEDTIIYKGRTIRKVFDDIYSKLPP